MSATDKSESLTLSQKKRLMKNLFGSDDISYSNKYSAFTYRSGYFYRMGRTTESTVNHLRSRISARYPEISVQIVGSGDHYASWPNDSYFWVRFNISLKEVTA